MADRFPWFPFYAADWRLSNTVRAMTYEQRGVYVELLVIAWDDGMERPSLPDDDTRLAALTGLGKKWAKVGRPVLEMCWTLSDGRWTNERLSHVWDVQSARYQLRSQAGKLGGIARSKREAKAKQNPSNASGLPDRSQPSASGFARQTQKSDSTKSSTGPTPLGALTAGAVGAAKNARPV